eukprot:scaffold16034_cov38-Cyclotella_meneghiniana.AAC.4
MLPLENGSNGRSEPTDRLCSGIEEMSCSLECEAGEAHPDAAGRRWRGNGSTKSCFSTSSVGAYNHHYTGHGIASGQAALTTVDCLAARWFHSSLGFIIALPPANCSVSPRP